MRIGLIIADFEMSFTTTFIHSARVMYGVDFNSSVINDILPKLKELKEKIENNRCTDAPVGWKIVLDDVIHVESLLFQIISRYKELYNVKPLHLKVYNINKKLIEAETPSAKDLAKEVLTELISPDKKVRRSKEEQMKEDAKNLSAKRSLNTLQKLSKK